MSSWRPHRHRRQPTDLFLAPWGPGTEVVWGTHAERSWTTRHGEFGVPKAALEELVVRRLPLRPDAWVADRMDRINRWIRLPNGRPLRVALETWRVPSPEQPGVVELVTLFLER